MKSLALERRKGQPSNETRKIKTMVLPSASADIFTQNYDLKRQKAREEDLREKEHVEKLRLKIQHGAIPGSLMGVDPFTLSDFISAAPPSFALQKAQQERRVSVTEMERSFFSRE
jgi:hypothetical protein